MNNFVEATVGETDLLEMFEVSSPNPIVKILVF